jgi:glycosyltransferase involved in cell wall biosynthesis
MPRIRPPHKKKLDIVFNIVSAHGERLHEPDYPEINPLGGSETAALRMAGQFRLLGHDVRIITDEAQLIGLTCDVFIALRIWQVFQNGFFPGKTNYLWCQDDANQPVVEALRNPEVAGPLFQRLNGVFMISHYQQVQWIKHLNLPLQKVIPTTNGIPLDKFEVNKAGLRQRKPWSYYSSTPFRGLHLLLQAWPSVRKAVPQAQLHLFTSMKVYNIEEKDSYTQLYEIARNLPGVYYRGSVGQAELRETAQKCRALAYPCTFPETSCIAAMEAMAAGCVVVGTSTGALIETAWQNPLVAPANDWLPLWTKSLITVLTDDEEYERLALQNLDIARYYDWHNVAHKWEKKFLEEIASEK